MSSSRLIERQLVAGLGAALLHRPGWKLEHGMSQQAGREPPRPHRAPRLPNLVAFVQVHQVDRKLHEKRVHGFARRDPQALAWLQPFVLQQAGTPLGAGISHLGSVSQDRVAGLVTH